MTKMKKFSESRKVAYILKVWSLLSTKIHISSKAVENWSVITHSSAALPVCANPAEIFFFTYYVPTNNLKLQSCWRNSILSLPIFSNFLNKHKITNELQLWKKYLCRISTNGRCRRRMSHHRPIFHRFWRNGYFCNQ